MNIAVNQLGLAAYIKMNGADLVEVVGKSFIFSTDKQAQEWRVEYNNSCCMKHDAVLCELRHFLKDK